MLLPVVLWLAALEGGLRVWRGAWLSAPSERSDLLDLHRSAFPVMYDRVLGYAPRPSSRVHDRWGNTVTITPDGLRSNGPGPVPAPPPLLAVGDSYTFGGEVGDRDTWPAWLERQRGQRVFNGGVFDFGFDQIVLRAEELLDAFPAEQLIVVIIPDDVLRCEFSYRYAWKPWYELVDGAIALRNVPVPPPGTPVPVSWLQRLAVYSHLADLTFRRLDPTAWALGGYAREHRRGPEVAALLVDRLAELAAQHEIPVLFVLAWTPGFDSAPAEPAVKRARARGLEVLVVEPELREAIGDDLSQLPRLFTRAPSRGRRFVANYMTPEGNRLLAELIARRLDR